MTKQLEDYKELDKWFDDNQEDPANFFCGVMDSEEVAKKILELAQQLEQANERVKELERLQSKHVWVTREEMKEYSDINQALSGKTLTQYDREVAVKAIEDFSLLFNAHMKEYASVNDGNLHDYYNKASNYVDSFKDKHLKQLKEGE